MNRILAILAFILITMALWVIAITPPASGYEISIYSAYPPHFWLFLIAAITCGIVIMVRHAFAEKPSRWWIAGFAAILLTNLVILLLPIFRDYATSRTWDVTTHIGYTKDIIFTAHFGAAGVAGENYYPAIHILMANLYYATGLKPELLVLIVPTFFTLFYMVSLYLLSKEISQSYGQAILITAFGSLLLFGIQSSLLFPSMQSFCMLPITLYLYYKVRTSVSKSLSYVVLFLLILLLTPFFHPVGTLLLILTFLCVEFSLLLYRKVNKRLAKDPVGASIQIRGISLGPSLILFIIWFTWFASLYIFGHTVRAIAASLVYAAMAMKYIGILQEVDLSLYQFIDLFMKMHGQQLLYFLAAVVISILVWKKFLSSKDKVDSEPVIFSFLFIIFGMLMLIVFVLWFSISYHRVIIYATFAATVLNGLGLYTLFHHWHKKTGMFVIALLLIAASGIGLFNTFPSPITRDYSSRFTAMELAGTGWFLEHQNEELRIDHILLSVHWFGRALVGVKELPIGSRHVREFQPPDHFGYTGNEMYGESYTEDRYFVSSKLSRIVRPEVFPEYEHLWDFTPKDFQRLEEDPSVSKVYSNGEFWVHYVRGWGDAFR